MKTLNKGYGSRSAPAGSERILKPVEDCGSYLGNVRAFKGLHR